MGTSSQEICRICGGAGTPDFVAGEHRMFRCGQCRCAFVHPQPTDEYLERFYATFHTSGEEGWYDNIESRMQSDFPAKLRWLTAHLSGKRVLDVGCAKGWFVKLCADAGLDAEGVDLSSTGVKYANEQLGVRAHLGALQQVAPSLGTFDGATFWATIEHVPDPVDTLRAINRVLKPGGVLALSTGIGDDWLDRLLPGRNQWYDPPQHLFVFSEKAFTHALNAAGFEPIEINTCFERSAARRAVRLSRALVAATALRVSAEVGRLRSGPFQYTRFPLGNVIIASARKVTEAGA